MAEASAGLGYQHAYRWKTVLDNVSKRAWVIRNIAVPDLQFRLTCQKEKLFIYPDSRTATCGHGLLWTRAAS